MKTITIKLTGNEDITLITEFMVLTIEHNQDIPEQEKAYQDLREEVTSVANEFEESDNLVSVEAVKSFSNFFNQEHERDESGYVK